MFFPCALNLDEALGIIRETVHPIWDEAEYERDDYGGRPEMFIYKDAEERGRWDDLGFCEETSGSMLYVMFDPGQITITYDGGTQGEELAMQIRKMLRLEDLKLQVIAENPFFGAAGIMVKEEKNGTDTETA